MGICRNNNHKRRQSKVFVLMLVFFCAAAFMPLLNGPAFAETDQPTQVQGLVLTQADTMKSVGKYTITVAWTEVAENVDKYKVEITDSSTSEEQLTDSNGTSITFEGTVGSAYQVRVCAISGEIQGIWSETQRIIVIDKRTALTSVTISSPKGIWRGEELTAVPYPNNAVNSVSWQWYRVKDDVATEIIGATKPEYKPNVADVGCYLKVVANAGDKNLTYKGTVSYVTKDPVMSDPLDQDAWYEEFYYEEGETTPASWSPTYDAREHVAFILDRKGYTIQYQQYDAKAATWMDIDKVTWKDATDTAAVYRAALTPTEVNPKFPVIDEREYPMLTIEQVNPYKTLPTVLWTLFNNWDMNSIGEYIVTEKQAADPASLLIFDDAYVVDMSEIKAFFNDTYIIEVEKSKANPNKQTWTVKDNWDNTSEEIQAKYAGLIAKYGTFAHDGLDTGSLSPISVEVQKGSDADTDTEKDLVDITYAPSMNYKIKKAKKLKKTQTFTCTAQTKSGKAVKWVLQSPNKKISIDSATGKVTVKKGLKKGTYKCKVTAKTNKGEGYLAAKDIAKIVIKIKK